MYRGGQGLDFFMHFNLSFNEKNAYIYTSTFFGSVVFFYLQK